jgi:hypothetical protein
MFNVAKHTASRSQLRTQDLPRPRVNVQVLPITLPRHRPLDGVAAVRAHHDSAALVGGLGAAVVPVHAMRGAEEPVAAVALEGGGSRAGCTPRSSQCRARPQVLKAPGPRPCRHSSSSRLRCLRCGDPCTHLLLSRFSRAWCCWASVPARQVFALTPQRVAS